MHTGVRQSVAQSNYASFGTKVLVYCHPRPPVHFTAGTIRHPILHFMKRVVPDLDRSEVHYVDPLIDSQQALDAWAHAEDGFSVDFVRRHERKFDAVFVPDCAGPFERRKDQSREAFIMNIVKTIDRLCALLKPGGKMFVSKLDHVGKWDSVGPLVDRTNDDLDRIIVELWTLGRSVSVTQSHAWGVSNPTAVSEQGATNWLVVEAT